MSKLDLYSYLNDRCYDFYNSITERFIHPLAGERKNSLLQIYWRPIIHYCQHAE